MNYSIGDRVRLIDLAAGNGLGDVGDEGLIYQITPSDDGDKYVVLYVTLDSGHQHSAYAYRWEKVEPVVDDSESTRYWVRVTGPQLPSSTFFENTVEHTVDDLENITFDDDDYLMIVTAAYEIQPREDRGCQEVRQVRSRTAIYPRGAWTSVTYGEIVPKDER